MLSFLEKFKSKEINEVDPNEKNSLIVSILIETAKSDGEFSEDEIDKIISIIKNKLKLEEKPAHDLFYKTLEINQDNIEMYSITKDIRDNFNADEIKGIIKYIWYVVLSDGHLDDFEAALMRKLTGLFHLTGKEAAEIKSSAEKDLGIKI